MKLFELQDRPVLDKVFPRNIMPQIRKNNLDDAGYEYEKKKIKLSKLKPVQDQRVQGMHDRALRGFQDGSIRPIIIDKFNYIVNGHHRYDVARSLDMNRVKVIKVNATIEELIDRFSETASDEPTIEEQLKAKLQQKLKEKDVVGMNPQAKKPYFTPQEADRAYDEWISQAQVDQGDGVIIKGTDGNQYRIMTSYGNQHFEDGEVYLDGVTDPDYIDTEGYPDAAELLYYHSATGHYPEEDYDIVERNLNPAVKDYVKGKKTKLINVKVADLDDEAIDDRFGRVIDTDPDVGVDLNNPILVDKDGKTILDGFHRVYQAKRIGVDIIPAEIIDENIKAEGDCYEAALKKLMDLYMKGNTTARVVHADITPRLGPLTGRTYGHAWVEDGDKVIDCSNNHTADIDEITGGRKDVYYGITDPKNIKIYNFQQLGKMVTKHHTYGPYPEPVPENFKDGKVKGKSRPGRVKRAGASCKGSVTSLRKKAKNSSGEKAKMYHWCANMKAGRKKK